MPSSLTNHKSNLVLSVFPFTILYKLHFLNCLICPGQNRWYSIYLFLFFPVIYLLLLIVSNEFIPSLSFAYHLSVFVPSAIMSHSCAGYTQILIRGKRNSFHTHTYRRAENWLIECVYMLYMCISITGWLWQILIKLAMIYQWISAICHSFISFSTLNENMAINAGLQE